MNIVSRYKLSYIGERMVGNTCVISFPAWFDDGTWGTNSRNLDLRVNVNHERESLILMPVAVGGVNREHAGWHLQYLGHESMHSSPQ